MKLIVAFLSGLVFGLGLGIGGMTQPAKIIGFLNVAGPWDPTLIFVMAAAVATSAVLFPLILRHPAPVLAERFDLPRRKEIDAQLTVGAALFGIGWGLSGYCPGPALVSIVTGATPVIVFVASMAAGLYVGGRYLSGVRGKTIGTPVRGVSGSGVASAIHTSVREAWLTLGKVVSSYKCAVFIADEPVFSRRCMARRCLDLLAVRYTALPFAGR